MQLIWVTSVNWILVLSVTRFGKVSFLTILLEKLFLTLRLVWRQPRKNTNKNINTGTLRLMRGPLPTFWIWRTTQGSGSYLLTTPKITNRGALTAAEDPLMSKSYFTILAFVNHILLFWRLFLNNKVQRDHVPHLFWLSRSFLCWCDAYVALWQSIDWRPCARSHLPPLCRVSTKRFHPCHTLCWFCKKLIFHNFSPLQLWCMLVFIWI